ncbi:MAG: DUF6171 family protein [Treponema sp.]|nr:DUF6171 family protein [Treponema sp.]
MSPAQAAEIAAAIPIAPSLRASDETYQARLDCCASCSGLREGLLCAWCGCFVRFRARAKQACCPCPSGDRWAAGEAPL